MRFVIVTGMSGAGKTMALKFLEDIGFFCVDNLPPTLISKFAEICLRAESGMDKVALGIDIRGGELLKDLLPELSAIMAAKSVENANVGGLTPEILYLDASNETIIKRYKETRRSHPLAKKGTIEEGISKEAGMLSKIKDNADFIIDTTNVLTRELKEKINDIFLDGKKFENIIISVISFGFKNGIPNDSDMVFDARFLPNPFYIPEMRELTGNDAIVSDYVLGFDASREFLKKVEEMIEFLLPNFRIEGKNRLVISIGCMGGRHRSVAFTNELFKRLNEKGHSLLINHRDIEKR